MRLVEDNCLVDNHYGKKNHYMKEKIITTFITTLLAVTELFATSALMAQNLTDVAFRQQGNTIVITYTLDQTATITITCSIDGGKTFPITPKHITGDVGNNVSGGNKTATWDVLEDMDKLHGEAIVFKVTAENSFMEMVYVKGGTFTMGCTGEQGGDCDDNEKPAHSVTVSSYYIGKYEVTQAQWREIMGSNPSDDMENIWPVDSVSWNDIQVFIEKLNAKTGKNYRLPTEAEWEFAARGGKQSKGYQYAGSNRLDSVAWDFDNSGGQTHPVGSKSPNELGIYDMSGNVWEWCSDWYGSYSSSSQTNPKGPQSGSDRVLRGGSLCNLARDCRVSDRDYGYPSYSNYYIGFRLVLSL